MGATYYRNRSLSTRKNLRTFQSSTLGDDRIDDPFFRTTFVSVIIARYGRSIFSNKKIQIGAITGLLYVLYV
jgi:hypothetical protein